MGSSLPVALGTRRIRRKRHEGEWWFAVEDLCGALMDSPDGAGCWRKLKWRLAKEGCEVGTLCHGLVLSAADGTARQVECVTLEGVFFPDCPVCCHPQGGGVQALAGASWAIRAKISEPENRF